jgi:hypothetical protein
MWTCLPNKGKRKAGGIHPVPTKDGLLKPQPVREGGC